MAHTALRIGARRRQGVEPVRGVVGGAPVGEEESAVVALSSPGMEIGRGGVGAYYPVVGTTSS